MRMKITARSLPVFDQLEAELRQIFVDRRVTSRKAVLKAANVLILKNAFRKSKMFTGNGSHAWQRQGEGRKKKDYAISLLS